MIVGVDAYRDPNTPNLSGACADAKAMRNHLIRDLKVPPTHITFLLSEDSVASEDSTLQSSGLLDQILSHPFMNRSNRFLNPEGLCRDPESVAEIFTRFLEMNGDLGPPTVAFQEV